MGGVLTRRMAEDAAMTLFAEGFRHECRQGDYCYEGGRSPDGAWRCRCGAKFEPRFISLNAAREHLKGVTPEFRRALEKK